MPDGRLMLAAVIAAICTSSTAQPTAGTAALPCPGGAVVVAGAQAQDHTDICAGAAAALAFLAQQGVVATDPVSFEVTSRLPPEAGPTAAGCYIEQRRRVYVVPYAAFLKHRTWFGVAIDRSLYRALAAHEAAHAVAACHFRVQTPSIQAKEYIAYAAMWSTMPPALRGKALRATRTVGLDSLDRFTPLLYMFDPMRFGAEAYLHFSTVPNQALLVQDILAGRALAD